MASDKKLAASEFGKFAEEVAVQHYIKKGYTILERNWRLGKTEIDIIAQNADTLILIEVKARSGRDEDALSAVTTDKRKRMIRAADSYLRKMQGRLDYRFDIVTVTGTIQNYEIDVYEDAFVATDVF